MFKSSPQQSRQPFSDLVNMPYYTHYYYYYYYYYYHN